MPLVVHGCVAADAAAYPFPSAPADVEFVRHRDVAAVVTQTDRDEVLPTRAALLRHAEVLERAADRTTVVPVRFGIVAPDAETLVASYLAPEHDRLIDRLRRLEGQVELRLRASYDEQAVLRRVLEGDRRAERLRGLSSMAARMELGERIAAGIHAQRDRDVRYVLDAVGSSAADVAIGAVSDPLDAFVLSVLVDRQHADDIEPAIAAVAEGLPHVEEIEVLGPLPPFSFASDGGGAR